MLHTDMPKTTADRTEISVRTDQSEAACMATTYGSHIAVALSAEQEKTFEQAAMRHEAHRN